MYGIDSSMISSQLSATAELHSNVRCIVKHEFKDTEQRPYIFDFFRIILLDIIFYLLRYLTFSDNCLLKMTLNNSYAYF